METWLSIWPVNLSNTGGLDPGWAQLVVTSSPQLLSLPSVAFPGLFLSWLIHHICLAREVEQSRPVPGTASLYIWSCFCLGCGEVIQWHFNRLSAFFAVALVLICRIKTQSVRHWTCCLVVEQRGSMVTARTAAKHFPVYGQGCAYQWQTKVFQSGDIRPLTRGWIC